MHDPKQWTRRTFLASATSAALVPAVSWASSEQVLSNATLVMPDGTTQTGGVRWEGGRITALGPKGFDLISDPLVTVVLEDGRSFQFTIYGAVAGTGIYALNRPDFRIMDALSLAGGTATTTKRNLVIREVAIDDTVKPGYERSPIRPGGEDGEPDHHVGV